MTLLSSTILLDTWKPNFTSSTGFSAGGVLGGDVTATYRLKFDVQPSNIAGTGPVSLIDSQAYAVPPGGTRIGPHPLPRRGDTYHIELYDGAGIATGTVIDSASGIYCRAVGNVKYAEKNASILDVEVRWGLLDPGQRAGDLTQTNPVLRTTRYWIEYESETKAIEKADLISPATLVDANGATVYTAGSGAAVGMPLLNAALRPFEDVLFEEDQVLVFVAESNVASYLSAMSLNETYRNTSNSDTPAQFGSPPAGTLAFRGAVTGEPLEENGTVFYKMQTRVAYKKTGWDVDVANVGMAHYTTIAPLAPTWSDDPEIDKKRIIDGNEPFSYSEPQKLSATGTLLPSSTAGNYITYRTKPRIAYASL